MAQKIEKIENEKSSGQSAMQKIPASFRLKPITIFVLAFAIVGVISLVVAGTFEEDFKGALTRKRKERMHAVIVEAESIQII